MTSTPGISNYLTLTCIVAMKNLTVRTRIILGFALVILIMMGLGGLVFNHLVQIQGETTSLTQDSLAGEVKMEQIQAASLKLEGAAERYLLTAASNSDTTSRADIDHGVADLNQLCSDYEGTIFTETDRQDFAALKAQRDLYLGTLRVTLQSRGAGAEEQLGSAFALYQSTVDKEVQLNQDDAEASAKKIQEAVASAKTAIGAGLMLSILLAVASGVILVNAINQPLSRVVAALEPMRRGDLSHRLALDRHDEFGVLAEGLNGLSEDLTTIIYQVQQATMGVTTSVAEIAATAREQQATASEIAATTTEVGATSKEISATSKELVKSMSAVSAVAERTADLAISGQDGLGRMESTMHQIMDASGSINERLAVLSERAGSIGTVVTTIAKVADQTNLLSLNAAIEAEKAGEYGRGFSVVASEIRRLADQTAVATLDIEQMVKEMQSAVSAGVMGLDKFSEAVRRGVEVVAGVGEQLAQIISQVQTLTPNFEAVNEGMQSQSLGAQQISDALVQLSEAATQTVESLEQSNVAIDGLNGTVRGLQGSVSRFSLAH